MARHGKAGFGEARIKENCAVRQGGAGLGKAGHGEARNKLRRRVI